MSELHEEHFNHQLGKVQVQLDKLEETIIEVRDLARDAIHICIGVDGHNGLRGTLHKLTSEVELISKEFADVREATKSNKESRLNLTKFLAASALVLITQFATAVWYMSAQHSKQENLRNDVDRLAAYVEKLRSTYPDSKPQNR